MITERPRWAVPVRTTALEHRESGRSWPSTAERGWRMLGWIGLVLSAVGLMDFLLVFYPARMGDPSWEFGAVDAGFSALPLLAMGTGLSLASAVTVAGRWRIRIWALFALLIGAAVAFALLIYLTNVPIALRLTPAEVRTGIEKSIMRTAIMGIAFSVSFTAAAVQGFRTTKQRREVK